MYFDRPGKDNTDQTLKLAAQRAKDLSLKEVVVASTTGFTAYKTVEIFAGSRITVVTYHSGFKEPFKNELPDDVKADLQNKGIKVVAASHALSGVERSIAKKHSGVYPVLIMADTLRLFGQGIKVAVEVAVMAADAGALTGNDIIAIGGSGRGADAALVLKPAHQNNFFDMRIREIICKPRSF
ncbi:MAG: pyruvate kinase alpha/beta domain-containing protein [Desulfobacterales bacterium]